MGSYKEDIDTNNHIFINYTRVTEVFGKEKFNLSPRKIVKAGGSVLESNSGLYDKSDAKARMLWLKTFDKELNLPRRQDMYNARFDNMKSHTILTFDTENERRIEIGREYMEPPADFGVCYV
jgi:hypothetical protein